MEGLKEIAKCLQKYHKSYRMLQIFLQHSTDSAEDLFSAT